MKDSAVGIQEILRTALRLLQRLLTVGENRLELVTLELQEQQSNLLFALLLGLGVAGFGLLAIVSLTAAIAILLWAWTPWAVLLVLGGFYAALAGILCWRLVVVLRDWRLLPATLDQFHKDRVTIGRMIS